VAVRIPPWIYGDLDKDLMARFTSLAPDADAIVLLQDFSGMYPLLAHSPIRAPIIADKHVVLARPRSAGEGGDLRGKLLRRLTASYERRYLALADRIVVTTEEDGEWLEHLYRRRPTAIIPTGVAIGPSLPTRPARQRVGWLSALDVVDNLDGLRRFLAEGWPSLAASGCELIVAGRNPVPEALRMTDVAGVTMLGHVDTIDGFLNDIDVGVIPLWSGRGIKVKTLTFMAAGIPVAATPMAVEGMAVVDGRHCLLAESPADLARAVRRLLDDQALADAIAAAGRQLVSDCFTWETLGAQFVGVVDRAIGSGT
jgi:glycosyltransferase involved in cell wall biosynthesis